MDRPSLYPQERRFLRRCAAHMACRHPVRWVVELGTGSGFSTQALAEGLSKFARPGEAAVLTVDDYREGEAYGWSRGQAECRIQEAGLSPWVQFSSESTHSEGWRHWAGAVHVLFVDAAHDYASASADFDTWVGKVPPGGVILCHDVHLTPEQLTAAGDTGLEDDGYLGTTLAFAEVVRRVRPAKLGRCGTVGWLVVPGAVSHTDGLAAAAGQTGDDPGPGCIRPGAADEA